MILLCAAASSLLYTFINVPVIQKSSTGISSSENPGAAPKPDPAPRPSYSGAITSSSTSRAPAHTPSSKLVQPGPPRIPQPADPARIAQALQALEKHPDMPSNLRSQVAEISVSFNTMTRNQVKKAEDFQRTIDELERAKNLAAARDLNVNLFDNSLDQVSEGQLSSNVEALNNAIDALVMNLIEAVTEKPPAPSVLQQAMKSPNKSRLFTTCAQLKPEDENRGLLTEALLHREIIHALHGQFFKGIVGVSLPGVDNLDSFYAAAIAKKGTLPASFRSIC
jgi:hypothetical protein